MVSSFLPLACQYVGFDKPELDWIVKNRTARRKQADKELRTEQGEKEGRKVKTPKLLRVELEDEEDEDDDDTEEDEADEKAEA